MAQVRLGMLRQCLTIAIRIVLTDDLSPSFTSSISGKTTTISMLTGMLEATAGSAKINGKSIQTNMNDIRQECGM